MTDSRISRSAEGPRRAATCSGGCAASARCGANLKYVQLSDGADDLYDLHSDAREQADLARTRPDDLAALRGAWEAINAQLLQY
jgi:hypothetical protein